MISIKIDLVPHGIESRRRPLAEGKIWNTGEGTATRGKYRFSFWKRTTRSARVGEIEVDEEFMAPLEGGIEGFPRKSYSVWQLLKLCLGSIDAR